MKRIKQILPIMLVFMIVLSTTVGAATVFNSKDITYSSSATSKKNVKEALDELYTKANTPWTCASGWYCYKQACPDGKFCLDNKIANFAKVGDYIKMTPISTSYTISKDLTGYDSDQTINPSELNLWRVIKVNADGTVEMVSDKVSSYKVKLKGKVAYMRWTRVLGEIVNQYTDNKNVQGIRNIGHGGQVWSCSSVHSDVCHEDSEYLVDIRLINVAYGGTSSCESQCSSLVAKDKSGLTSNYWLSSRGSNIGAYDMSGRRITVDGSSEQIWLYKNYTGTGQQWNSPEAGIRPIVTLKSSAGITGGKGSIEAPFILK